ncbi:GerAB/ArcD/ProY family transporter [Peribacillus frigoritolerans]|uniref:GerAB/ArcD/ProY family transporter n=1 Tax=Peribacillus frigoritolerans TaxID=450367 RepID=UPI00105AAC46|nr:GerAB/ArcD/ProY family transporter [Peribacillus frigoritolerans]TDL80201.1 spore gernimation protein GerB [Peribacillus frigoritolerans]
MKKIAERYQVSPFLVFFLIHSLQFGVGVLGFQRFISLDSGHDAWIAVLASGVVVHISIFLIYQILKDQEGNILDIHKKIFGKWIGNGLNAIVIIYFAALAINVLRTFIEVIQVWMFPDLNVWIYSFIFLVLAYYILNGGFRVVAGICFFGVVLPGYLIFTFLFTLKFANYNNLMPFFDHSISDLLKSTKNMSLTVLGFEALFMYYPFLKNPEKSKKWAHFGAAVTTFIYVIIMLFSIIYFSEEQLQKNVWATLTIWKIVEMPFVERFEYIGIANWNLVILPNVCLTLWCASRGMKQLVKIKQKYTILIVLAVSYAAVNVIKDREQINTINTFLGEAGFYIYIAYIPILYLLTLIYRKWKGGKKIET